MNLPPENNNGLERLIHRTLRELPLRRAPHSLESRVLTAIAQRAALPWWRRSFGHWPPPARIAFLVLSAGLVKVALMAAVWVMGGFDGAQFKDAFAPQFAWLEATSAVVSSVVEFFDLVVRNIPSLWLYGGLAFVATMYAALFGLGATAYRTLYANR